VQSTKHILVCVQCVENISDPGGSSGLLALCVQAARTTLSWITRILNLTRTRQQQTWARMRRRPLMRPIPTGAIHTSRTPDTPPLIRDRLLLHPLRQALLQLVRRLPPRPPRPQVPPLHLPLLLVPLPRSTTSHPTAHRPLVARRPTRLCISPLERHAHL